MGGPRQTEGQQPRGRKQWREKGPQNTTRTTRKRREPNNRRGKEDTPERERGETKRRKKRKREKKNKTKKGRTRGKDGKGRKGGKRARPQPALSGRANTNVERRRRQDQEEEEEGENIRAELPYCATDLNTGQTRGAVDSFGGPPKDCSRVFPMKGAANALCNPKADVPRGVAGHAWRARKPTR